MAPNGDASVKKTKKRRSNPKRRRRNPAKKSTALRARPNPADNPHEKVEENPPMRQNWANLADLH